MKRSAVQAQVKRRGQGLVEYIIIIAAVAFISLGALSMFGHKVSDQYAVASGMLPGAHGEDNLSIATGFFAGLEDGGGFTTATGAVSWETITGNADGDGELENNVIVFGGNDGEAFVAD